MYTQYTHVYSNYNEEKIFGSTRVSNHTIAFLEPANTHRHLGFKALNYKVLDINTFTIISRFQTHENDKKKIKHPISLSKLLLKILKCLKIRPTAIKQLNVIM